MTTLAPRPSTGGSAFLYGFSSGGLLALQAAATGFAIPRLALLEPPIEAEEDRKAQQEFTGGLVEVLATGDRAAAVDYYLTGIGVPEEIIAGMRGTSSWTALEAAAPTLVYDCLISEATSFEVLSRITAPTLVLGSEGSSDDLQGMAATVARAMPNATHHSLAGEWHGCLTKHWPRCWPSSFSDRPADQAHRGAHRAWRVA
jgi:pimeloyl-ACP methyl ester carboxylesterase